MERKAGGNRVRLVSEGLGCVMTDLGMASTGGKESLLIRKKRLEYYPT
jgi:hypothetical protein